jgi:HK97 family phage major capsid protein
MNKKQKLLAAKAAERQKMLALDALATRENRDLTTEETTQMQASIDLCAKLDSDILIAEALLEAERDAATVGSVVVGADLAENKPFASLAEQMSAIKVATVSPHKADVRLHGTNARVVAAQGGSELIDSDGGYFLAPEIADGIFRRTFAQSPVTSRCRKMPMKSNRLILNGANDASRADGQRNGGITSFWTYEAGNYTKSKPTFRQIALQVDKLTAFTYATDELLEDADAWQAYVDDVVPDEFDFKVTDAIFNGPGNNGPLGINNSGSIVKFARTNNGAAPIAADIFLMYKRIPAYLRPGAAWFINQDMEDSLWNMVRGSGTAVELLYTPPGLKGNNTSYGVLLGLPVIPIEQASTTGTLGDITLAAFNQYQMGVRGGVKKDTSIHVAFLTGEQAFRWQMRVAGESLWDKPVTPKNGTFTQSPFVQIS